MEGYGLNASNVSMTFRRIYVNNCFRRGRNFELNLLNAITSIYLYQAGTCRNIITDM